MADVCVTFVRFVRSVGVGGSDGDNDKKLLDFGGDDVVGDERVSHY
jgi:hypothetical protein